MEEKKNIKKIDSYEQLIEKLKLWEVSPQETWDLVEKIKFNTKDKTIWKMSKFHMYIEQRILDMGKENRMDKVVEIAEKSELMGRAHMIEFYLNVKKILPKRVDSIRSLVKSARYKSKFEYFNKNKKFDERAEIKNLEKLIIDKRQNVYWDPKLFADMEKVISETRGARKPFDFEALPGRELLKVLR
tara:strand:- start:221 stop:781 length:561 start_codon:yes stop_codon:yes gene_type:complete